MDLKTNMSDVLEKQFRVFSKTGWNSNGSRMLAVASIVAKKSEKKIKKKFADFDIFAVFVLVSFAIKFLVSVVPMLIVCALSSSVFVIKKLLTKCIFG